MPAAKQINTDGLSEGDFQTLATKLEAASAMLGALAKIKATTEVWNTEAYSQTLRARDRIHRLAREAIAQAEAAGIKGES